MFRKMSTPDPRPAMFLVPYHMCCLLQKRNMHGLCLCTLLQIHCRSIAMILLVFLPLHGKCFEERDMCSETNRKLLLVVKYYLSWLTLLNWAQWKVTPSFYKGCFAPMALTPLSGTMPLVWTVLAGRVFRVEPSNIEIGTRYEIIYQHCNTVNKH